MDFSLSDEQAELRDMTREFLDKRFPEQALRQAVDSGTSHHDAAMWTQLATELGLAGILVPEAHGGLGLGAVEAGVVLRELGRSLAPTPFLASSGVAATAILNSGDAEAIEEYLPPIAEGSLVAAFATTEESGEPRVDDIATSASQVAGQWRLTGTKRAVLNASEADLLVVTATTTEGIAFFLVEGSNAVLGAVDSLDLTRSLSDVTLTDAPARLLGTIEGAAELWQRTMTVAWALVAAEQLGTTERCLESAVEYANVREQFGQTIGSFQAVQHRLADILVAVESAASAVDAALRSIDRGDAGQVVDARVAAILGAEALSYAAGEGLHLHGGNGFTWEYPEHLAFRRARASALLFGSPATHRERLADELDLSPLSA